MPSVRVGSKSTRRPFVKRTAAQRPSRHPRRSRCRRSDVSTAPSARCPSGASPRPAPGPWAGEGEHAEGVQGPGFRRAMGSPGHPSCTSMTYRTGDHRLDLGREATAHPPRASAGARHRFEHHGLLLPKALLGVERTSPEPLGRDDPVHLWGVQTEAAGRERVREHVLSSSRTRARVGSATCSATGIERR